MPEDKKINLVPTTVKIADVQSVITDLFNENHERKKIARDKGDQALMADFNAQYEILIELVKRLREKLVY